MSDFHDSGGSSQNNVASKSPLRKFKEYSVVSTSDSKSVILPSSAKPQLKLNEAELLCNSPHQPLPPDRKIPKLHRKTTSQDDNIIGRLPEWKMTSTEDRFSGRQRQADRSTFSNQELNKTRWGSKVFSLKV